MSKRNTTLATAFFAGLLALSPAFAQNQGATTGSTTAGSPRNTESDETQNQGSTQSGSTQGTQSGTTQGTQSGTTQGSQGGTTQGGSTQGRGGIDNRGTTQLSQQDQNFIMNAAADGMMEVELGRLAAQKASNADVRSFGQRMVDDHSKANTQLMSIARQKNVTPPATLPADKRQEVDKMSRLSGAEFDRMYMSHMLMAHKKDIAEFERTSTKSGDSSLKSFAQQTLPTLREHMQIAQGIASKVGASEDHAMHGSHQ